MREKVFFFSSLLSLHHERKKEKKYMFFTLMKGSPCLYRFVKMRSSSAMPPKLVRSAGAAGAEAGPAAAAAAAEAEKDADDDDKEVEVEVAESDEAALGLFFSFFFQAGEGEGRLEWDESARVFSKSSSACSLRVRELGSRCGRASTREEKVKKEMTRAERRSRGERHGGGSNGKTKCFLFSFSFVSKARGVFFFRCRSMT